MTMNYKLLSLQETANLAHTLSLIAQPNMVILLNGNLGAGKTQLTKFIGKELKITETITSPTFVILNQYNTNKSWKLVHIDAYRLNSHNNFAEYFELMLDNFTIIEWAQNLNFDFSKLKTITININFSNNIRNVELTTTNLDRKEEQILKDNL